MVCKTSGTISRNGKVVKEFEIDSSMQYYETFDYMKFLARLFKP